MASSKLRKANLGIPLLPASEKNKSKPHSHESSAKGAIADSPSDFSPYSKQYQRASMDGCMASSAAFSDCGSKSQSHPGVNNSSSSSGSSSGSSSKSHPKNVLHSHSHRFSNGRSSILPTTPNKHVNFGLPGQNEEKKREKFLTAKYGAHQMALIRKRLRVEMWMYERLQELYGGDDIEIDLDEVLDIENDNDRRRHISSLLPLDGRVASPDLVSVFVEDLLERVKTL